MSGRSGIQIQLFVTLGHLFCPEMRNTTSYFPTHSPEYIAIKNLVLKVLHGTDGRSLSGNDPQLNYSKYLH